MNCILKISAIILATFFISLSANACEVKELRQVGFTGGDVFSAGDLKLKIVSENGPFDPRVPGHHIPESYSVTIDLKAPPKYIKRGIELRIGQGYTETICGQEVSIVFESTSSFKVTAF